MTDAAETLTIDAFIDARLRQDEAIARAATPGPWRYDPTKEHIEINTGLRSEGVFTGPDGPDAICVATTGDSDDRPSMRDARFIARHDPDRTLREVARNRRVLERHRRLELPGVVMIGSGGPTCAGCGVQNGYRAWPCAEVRDLASIWSDHPDFRAEWSA
ncbi:DUF6221 family protein [Nocardia africana]